VHARRIRTAPASGPIDRRRLAAAGLSAVLPGLGQAFNRRARQVFARRQRAWTATRRVRARQIARSPRSHGRLSARVSPLGASLWKASST
jgi:hypothetical protein